MSSIAPPVSSVPRTAPPAAVDELLPPGLAPPAPPMRPADPLLEELRGLRRELLGLREDLAQRERRYEDLRGPRIGRGLCLAGLVCWVGAATTPHDGAMALGLLAVILIGMGLLSMLFG